MDVVTQRWLDGWRAISKPAQLSEELWEARDAKVNFLTFDEYKAYCRAPRSPIKPGNPAARPWRRFGEFYNKNEHTPDYKGWIVYILTIYQFC